VPALCLWQNRCRCQRWRGLRARGPALLRALRAAHCVQARAVAIAPPSAATAEGQSPAVPMLPARTPFCDSLFCAALRRAVVSAAACRCRWMFHCKLLVPYSPKLFRCRTRSYAHLDHLDFLSPSNSLPSEALRRTSAPGGTIQIALEATSACIVFFEGVIAMPKSSQSDRCCAATDILEPRIVLRHSGVHP